MTLTPIDKAHAAMEAAPDDDTARLRFYERVADAELFLLLLEDPNGDDIAPQVITLPEATFVLAFDTQDRLAEFVGEPAPYAALSGRVIAAMLAEQKIGLGLNLEIAPSAMLLPPEAVAWLSETLGHGPQEVEERITEFTAPIGLPEPLLTALDQKLSTTAGLAHSAYLVGVVYESGSRGHLLGYVDALDQAKPALAKAASEALTFSGIEAGAMDVGFFASTDAATAQLARAGLRFDLPQAQELQQLTMSAPGMDPDKPPKLK